MTDYSELKRLVAQGSLPPIVEVLINEIAQIKAVNFDHQNGFAAASAEIVRLQAENKELRDNAEEGLAVIRTMRHQVDCYIQDAERYRFLRNGPDDLNFDIAESMEELDAIIDAAMSDEVKP
ncbi:hypothetical protein [Pseudomonas hormoni]